MTGGSALADTLASHFAADPPASLGVAVSGGSDSLALLHLLHDWNAAALEVVTVDHGLRPEAAAEAAHVAAICAGLGHRHSVLRWQPGDASGNLQDRARRARYRLIANWAAARGLGAVCLGHTMDDQAETLLMRLARGAGVDGLSAMRARFDREGMRFDRPLLGLRRDALRDLLAARGVRWVEDRSNSDARFERVKARQAMQALAPLGLDAPVLADVARNLRDASDALGDTAQRFARDKLREAAGDLIFDRTALRRLPREIRRRLLAGALQWVASAPYPPRRAPLEEVMTAAGEGGNLTLHGCRILISDMTVRITREAAAVAGTRCGTEALWDGRWRMEGPHAPQLEVGALGEAVGGCTDWRESGLPRATLLASPAVWDGERLIAAPLAGWPQGWSARLDPPRSFAASLIAH